MCSFILQQLQNLPFIHKNVPLFYSEQTSYHLTLYIAHHSNILKEIKCNHIFLECKTVTNNLRDFLIFQIAPKAMLIKTFKTPKFGASIKINIFKKLFAQTFKCISHSALQFNSCTLTITLNGIKTQHKKHNYEKAPQHIV